MADGITAGEARSIATQVFNELYPQNIKRDQPAYHDLQMQNFKKALDDQIKEASDALGGKIKQRNSIASNTSKDILKGDIYTILDRDILILETKVSTLKAVKAYLDNTITPPF